MTKPTIEAIRAEVAELVSQCPSKAAHDVAAYLASKNYRYGIIAVLIALTQDNCYVNVSDDEDDLIDYIAKATVKHWGESTGGFVDRLLLETFDIVYGDTTNYRVVTTAENTGLDSAVFASQSDAELAMKLASAEFDSAFRIAETKDEANTTYEEWIAEGW